MANLLRTGGEPLLRGFALAQLLRGIDDPETLRTPSFPNRRKKEERGRGEAITTLGQLPRALPFGGVRPTISANKSMCLAEPPLLCLGGSLCLRRRFALRLTPAQRDTKGNDK